MCNENDNELRGCFSSLAGASSSGRFQLVIKIIILFKFIQFVGMMERSLGTVHELRLT